MAEEFLHFYPNTLNGACTMDRELRKQAKATWLCSGCSWPRPDIDQFSIVIQERSPGKGMINFVAGFGVILMHESLIEALDPERVRNDFIFGEFQSPNWYAVVGRNNIVVRGSEHVAFRICKDCGRKVYYAGGTRYLCPKPVNSEILYHSDLSGVVFSASKKLSRNISKAGLGTDRLEVLDHPLDGLGINLED